MDQDNNQQFPEQQNPTAQSQQQYQVQHVSSTQQHSRDQAKLQQDQMSLYRQDVRIKRHPELQPFVPSDRFTTFSTSSSTTTVNNVLTTTTKSPSTNPIGKQSPYTTNKNEKPSKSQASSLSSGQPKKFVSMTRLSQLAQPKKRQSPPKPNQSLTRTNNSSSQEDSVNRTINKSQERRSSAKDSRQSKPLNKSNEDTISRVTSRSQRDNGIRAINKSRRDSGKGADNKSREELANRTIDKGQEQQSENLAISNKSLVQKGNRTVDKGQEASANQALNETDQGNPTDNHVFDESQEPHANQTLYKGQQDSRDRTVDKNVEDLCGDWAINKIQKDSSNLTSQITTTTNNSDLQKKSPHEMSLAEQISEVSINDPFYESAASELVPESENSDNSINFDGPLNQSLLRELEQDLNMMSHNQSQNRQTDSLGDDISQDSATTVADTPSPKKKIVPTLEEEQEEDDRRIRIEKELREKARLEEEERKQRDQIVENILSRFSQGSVS